MVEWTLVEREFRHAHVDGSPGTTHPIEVSVASTDDFYSVFDAITYDKGSSVLRQLSHFVGPKNFRAGVSSYLKEHTYANTTLQDFVNSQAEASSRDLEAWVEQWLYQPGYNLLQPQIECGAGRIRESTGGGGSLA